MHLIAFAFVIIALLGRTASSFVFSRINRSWKGLSKSMLANRDAELSGELDKFFEQTSLAGSAKIRKLSLEERAERALQGGILEDKIFDLRDNIILLGKT